MKHKEEIIDKLDALIAAPQHHKLLFENEFVRVLDANIPAGKITNVHTLYYPASLYFISWSNFIRYDVDGNVLLDSRTLEKIPLWKYVIIHSYAIKNY
jgi:hypothetical protein